jgi:NAD(P)-dependent dehydrogenase (short-subunit alcohol dehydrogenase family)
MNLQLDGKRTLVTGSTAGIGFAIARALAREGASVVITGRTQERVGNAIEDIRNEIRDAKITGIAVDLAMPGGISKCIQAAPAIDILVNNLGVYEPKPFEQITDDGWREIIETNFMSGVGLSRHYLLQMKAANWGRIIFISSESAINNSGGDDPLRSDQDDAGGARARIGRDDGAYSCHREFGACRSHSFGRC